jgi:hypothetical protein
MLFSMDKGNTRKRRHDVSRASQLLPLARSLHLSAISWNAVDAAVVVGLLTAVTVVIWGRKFANRSTNQVRLLLSFQQHNTGANLNRFIELMKHGG